MSAIFVNTEEFEKVPPIMLRRTLLELVAIRYAARGEHSVPLGRMLKDAGLPSQGRESSLALRAVAYNNIVYVDHQELFNTIYLNAYTELDVIIECNGQFVEKWVSMAGGGNGAYTFDGVRQDTLDLMIKELDGSIDQLRKHLKDSIPDCDRGISRR